MIKKQGTVLQSRQSTRIYESAAKELMDKSARKLLNPNSDEFKEIILKYDKAWQELAKK